VAGRLDGSGWRLPSAISSASAPLAGSPLGSVLVERSRSEPLRQPRADSRRPSSLAGRHARGAVRRPQGAVDASLRAPRAPAVRPIACVRGRPSRPGWLARLTDIVRNVDDRRQTIAAINHRIGFPSGRATCAPRSSCSRRSLAGLPSAHAGAFWPRADPRSFFTSNQSPLGRCRAARPPRLVPRPARAHPGQAALLEQARAHRPSAWLRWGVADPPSSRSSTDLHRLAEPVVATSSSRPVRKRNIPISILCARTSTHVGLARASGSSGPPPPGRRESRSSARTDASRPGPARTR